MFPAPTTRLALPPSLLAAWNRSRTVGDQLATMLAVDPPEELEAVVAVGSLGRMELTAHSDLDLVVLIRDETPTDDPWLDRFVYESVWGPAESLGYSRPKPKGVFAEPARPAELCSTAARGRIDERPNVFGKRLQLLLEGRPLYGAEAYERLLKRILRWYGFDSRQPEPFQPWSFLLHDLERYRHSLAVRYQWLRRESPTVWRPLNLKAMFSRRLNLTGLRVLLGEFSIDADSRSREGLPFAGLVEWLCWSPLERLTLCNDPDALSQVAERYDEFHAVMSDATRRAAIGDRSAAPYDRLVAIGNAFAVEVGELVARRSLAWDRRFRASAWA